MLSAFTAGHFIARRRVQAIADLYSAIEWFRAYPEIPKKHDQSLMHIASLIGNWKILNLCRPPHYWLSSWAGDYNTALELVQAIQLNENKGQISHLHYSGSTPSGTRPIEELLYSRASPRFRLQSLIKNGVLELSGYSYAMHVKKRLVRRVSTLMKNKS